jgi:hypothetical protein
MRTPREHTTSFVGVLGFFLLSFSTSTEARETSAPARRSTSATMTASISSVPSAIGTRTVFFFSLEEEAMAAAEEEKAWVRREEVESDDSGEDGG